MELSNALHDVIYSQETESGPAPEDGNDQGRWLGADRGGLAERRPAGRRTTGADFHRDYRPNAKRRHAPHRRAIRRNQGTTAGYYILECGNLDQAIEWAAKIPTGCKGSEGSIEIRPIPEMPGLTRGSQLSECLTYAPPPKPFSARSRAGL